MQPDPTQYQNGEARTYTQEVRDKIRVDWRLWFYAEPEKQLFKVRCISPDRRFMICTRPYNPQRTVLYCILDFKYGRRGPDNMVFGFGYETQEQIEARMRELCDGEMEVSHRRGVRLVILKAFAPGDKVAA